MKERTKQLQVTKDVYRKVLERDEYCILCKQGYNMHPKFPTVLDCQIMDPAHFINKSQGGLGIEQNIVILCRYHHHLYDNGGLRKEITPMLENYLKSKYDNWNKKDLVFRK